MTSNTSTQISGVELIPKVFSCVLSRDQETGRWNGHCLDLDIVTSGTDRDAAWANLKNVVRRQVEQCFTNWKPGLLHKAGQEHWRQFELLCELNQNKPFRQDTIQLELIEPVDTSEEWWMKAFATQEGILNGKTPQAALMQ